MSCQNTEDVRIIVKYSSFPGETPTIPNSANHEDGTWLPTDLYVGEMFINAYDNKAWVRGISGIFPLGATGGTVSFIGDYVPASTGGTFSGPVTTTTLTTGTVSTVSITASNIFGDVITANYFIGDGSGLTNIQAVWNGGTVSNPVLFLGDTTHNGFTNINGTIKGDAANNVKVSGNINVANGYGVSASYFKGDGSQLTNLPVGTYSNYYTTDATLSGNTIVFDRTDLAGAYSVDLTPILATDSIAAINWDSTTGELDIVYTSGYQVSAVIDAFPDLTTNILNANYVYGGEFWGSFNGTFSGFIDGDIYTTSATLNGSVIDFSRTDGTTYSVDLSTLSGSGGTQSLLQTLKQGNTMGTYSIVGGTGSVVAKLRVYDEFINMRNEGLVDTVDISMSPSEILVYNSTGKGIQYDSPDPNLFMTNTLVHKQYVDGITGLENTLAKSNTTGAYDINVTNGQRIYSDETYLSEDLTHNISFGGSLPGALRLHSINNTSGPEAYIDILGSLGNMVLHADNDITIYGQNSITIGEIGTTALEVSPTSMSITGTYPYFQGVEYASDYSANFTNRSLVDKEYVDNRKGLIDVVCNRTDEIFVDASGGDCNPYVITPPSFTTIRSYDTGFGKTASITIDPEQINLNVVQIPGSYESNINISDEVLTIYGGLQDANNYNQWSMELGVEKRRYNYRDNAAPWGAVEKAKEERWTQHWKFSSDAGTPGTMDLWFENFEQEAINDYEVDFYIMNPETYGPQRTYMTKSFKRRVHYDNYNQAVVLIPDETKKGDYNINPAYDSWDITIQSAGFYGNKYVLDWNLGNSYDFSVTMVVRWTSKKY